MQENVKVEEITGATAAPEREIDLGGKENLQATMVEPAINMLRSNLRKNGKRIFELSWNGGPMSQASFQGLRIAGREIAWMDHGIVDGSNGFPIGTFEMVKKRGGQNQDEWALHIFLDTDEQN